MTGFRTVADPKVRRVLLTGSTGFIGSAILAALHRRRTPDIRVLLRPRHTNPPTAAVTVVSADLADPRTIAGICDDVDLVIHAASYIGPDPRRCALVNEEGTANLVRTAVQAGIGRLLYVSTAAVYGTGPHRGAVEGALTPSPSSPTSTSRLAAEQSVRSAGGVVLRPHLVYGAGDRWVLPSLVALLKAPGLIDGGTAKMSMISVRDLARVALALALDRPKFPHGAMYHANHPRPVSLREVIEALATCLGVSAPGTNLSRAAASAALPHLPARVLDLAATDHWYDSTRIWRDAGCQAGRPPHQDLHDATNCCLPRC
ncbi:NAD-dependent epimerase/dehydratase family protein [Micromonospora sp. ALFpr18c]|uniref:NAD-dependent epimerase/dehydratase family protein n=1 Tax=unclassified Micromonospora TaxID=2617518 RepID=UPI00124B75D5|nr:NAD-dependent epimerase/dehydratase family protein [Micromonospora sp. ALFpr18c]KAB1927663.1 NAD-dependent epimerase/dehydratase family protein [Micromonospora sp. ALFpr18c]